MHVAIIFQFIKHNSIHAIWRLCYMILNKHPQTHTHISFKDWWAVPKFFSTSAGIFQKKNHHKNTLHKLYIVSSAFFTTLATTFSHCHYHHCQVHHPSFYSLCKANIKNVEQQGGLTSGWVPNGYFSRGSQNGFYFIKINEKAGNVSKHLGIGLFSPSLHTGIHIPALSIISANEAHRSPFVLCCGLFMAVFISIADTINKGSWATGHYGEHNSTRWARAQEADSTYKWLTLHLCHLFCLSGPLSGITGR